MPRTIQSSAMAYGGILTWVYPKKEEGLMKGWVYVITTQTHNLVKVGYTDRDPEARAAELNDTSSPHPHEVQYAALVEEPREREKLVHSALSEHREGKEWFGVTVAEAILAIQKNGDYQILYEQYSPEQLRRIETTEQLRLKENQLKEKPLLSKADKRERSYRYHFYKV